MNDDLRLMLDAASDLIDGIRKDLWKLEQVVFAIGEESEDDPASDELPMMLADAAKYAANCAGGLMAARDYISDIAKEIL